ncbi:hypothetical protein FRC09_016512 [Ceratobasidium sp. 395]|nr:hypothetical protein FRC09_016512 [Ceratobasidium sp. 395]
MPPMRDSVPSTSKRRKNGGLIIATRAPTSPSLRASSAINAADRVRPFRTYKLECSALNIAEIHPMQKSVLDSIVSDPKRDQFIIAATGSGKSLLFELPAILPEAQGKLTVVFIPRVASIRIELERLLSCGVRAEARYKRPGANSSAEVEAQNRRFFEAINDPSKLPQLLLVMPHQLEHTETTFQHILAQLYERGLIQRFVFDEIHLLLDKCKLIECLSDLRKKFRDIPATLLSASLSPSTRKELKQILKLNAEPTMFPLDRPNIYYRVLAKLSSGEDWKESATLTKKEETQLGPILELAKEKYPRGSGLVYCRSQDACKRMASILSSAGVPSEPYDSELSETEPGSAAFNRWIRNDPNVQVLVTAVALSSEVHKPDVRFVVHTSIPTSGIDGYMQETGRAGRDGDKATCLLLYAFGDAFKVCYDTQYQIENVHALLRFINFPNCRRRSLLSYYGDEKYDYGASNPRCCDVCDSWDIEQPPLDITSIACRALRYYERQRERVGAKLLGAQLHKHFGAVEDKTTDDMWTSIVHLLIIERYLEKDRPGQGGGKIKIVRSLRTNNLMRSGGRVVLLPWFMRFKEYHLGEPTADLPLLWTEELTEKLAEIEL